jgi:glycine/D-amino acid oxidase-like deaminating enzyme
MDDIPVIVGGGLAGLMTALSLAPQAVIVIAKAPLAQAAASAWAQGGIAAAVGEDDTPSLHASDTLDAGDGLGDADVSHRITDAAPATVALPDRHAWSGVGPGFDAVDGALRARLGERLARADAAALPHAADVARLGATMFARGEAIAPERLEPAYLRDNVALTLAEQASASASASAKKASTSDSERVAGNGGSDSRNTRP